MREGRRKGMREGRKEGGKEMFYLTTHSTHFINSYMVSDIWLRTTQQVHIQSKLL